MIVSPPKHLSASAKTFWCWATETYRLAPDALKVLETACVAWDTGESARKTLQAEGSYYTDRHGVIRVHPAIRVQRESKALFLRSLTTLGLEPPKDKNTILAHQKGDRV